jgi:hypothetical protein
MEREGAKLLEGRVARLILLVVVSMMCVVFCVLCSNQWPDDCIFFSGHNFFQFPTDGQTIVPFFPVVIFSNWCSCQNTNTNYNPKKLRPEKKDTVVWPAMFFELPEKLTTGIKGTVVWPMVENRLSCQNTNTPIMTGKKYYRKKRYNTVIWSSVMSKYEHQQSHFNLRKFLLGFFILQKQRDPNFLLLCISFLLCMDLQPYSHDCFSKLLRTLFDFRNNTYWVSLF